MASQPPHAGQQQQQQPSMMGQPRPGQPPAIGQPGVRPPQQGGMPPPAGQFAARPPPPQAGGPGFARPPPGGAPLGGLGPGQPAGAMQRPASTGPAPYPQGARPPPPVGMAGARPMSPPQGMVNRNGSLTPGPPGQPQQGRMSPRPPMPAGTAAPGQTGMQARPPMPGQPMQSPPLPHQSLHGQMAGMNLNQQQQQPGGAPSPAGAQPLPPPPSPAGEAGPARTKRSARAYHMESQPTGANAGWNDASTQPNPPQAPWQQAAAARVAGYESQLQGNANAALDQMPGQRNTVSWDQLAHNQALMVQQNQGPGQHQRAPLQPQGGPDGAFSQAMPPQQPGGGIAQPPHQAGQRFAGPRSKIDPDQIPSPVEMQDADQEFFDKEWFATCGRGGLPLSTTSFAAVDQGSCSPKHIRLTTYSMPATDELATTSQLPIALLLQPFAQLRADEALILTAHFGESGPPRCKRCRAYINAWCVFVEGGQKWTCNLCGTTTDVAADYFCNLDISGRRVDFDSRPELSRGTVDFAVPKEYWAIQATPPASVLLPVAPASTLTETAKLSPRPDASKEDFDGSTMGLTGQGGQAAKVATKAASDAFNSINIGKGRTTVRAPRPMTYLFAIDVSFSAVRCGALKSTVDSIRETLYGAEPEDGAEIKGTVEGTGDAAAAEAEGPGFGLPHGSRVAIITFDRALHFYNLSSELDQAQMLVVADVEEPFVPISDGLLADPWESRDLIEILLTSLPTMFADNMEGEAALGAAIRGAQAALSTIGGQVNLFLSTIPTVGPGSLKHREDTKLYGTDKEKNLFIPQDGFYRGVAEECVEAGIGINVFFFPSQYIDVATISVLTGLTGGEAFFHPRYDPVRDSAKLRTEVRRTILRETGYNVTMRVRCSNGLRVADHYGNFFQRNVTDIELGTMDADKCIAALIKHEGKLDEKHEVYFQCAVLYTTAQGERRVRCHNLAVPVSSLLGNVFRYADIDSAVAFYMKETISLAHTKPLKDVRHYLTDKCVKVLLAYRRNCASSTSPGQLILPESFKLFPLYALAINKTKAIKGGNVTSDVRTFYMRLLRGAGVPAIMAMLYPRMIALHTMREDDGEPIKIATPDGSVVEGARIKSPALMRPSYLRMESHGAYLLENGEVAILWLGAEVNPKLVEDLYGVARIDDVDPRMTRLPRLPTKLSKQVRALVQNFAVQRNKPELPVLIARQNRDGTEVELANSLVEDQNNDAMSYVDYLCHVHRIISSDMTSGKDEGGSWFSS